MDKNNRSVTDSRTVARVISKRFKRLQDAERFQSLLYGKFNSVQLVAFPRFSQEGEYIWNVNH